MLFPSPLALTGGPVTIGPDLVTIGPDRGSRHPRFDWGPAVRNQMPGHARHDDDTPVLMFAKPRYDGVPLCSANLGFAGFPVKTITSA